MPAVLPDLASIAPEIFVLTMACVLLVIDLFLKNHQRNITYWLAQLTLVGALLIIFTLGRSAAGLTFAGTVVNDTLSLVLKSFTVLVTAIVLMYSRPYLADRALHRGEYYVLGLLGALGAMVMISAYSFIILYLGLELLSLSLYALVAFDRDSPQATEAAMKYFVLGAMASGMLLYGMSIVYGVTGALDLILIHRQVMSGGVELPLLLGLAFIIVGVTFKLGAVPFHMWVPDVYQGAPTSVTLYIGTISKIAAFAIAIRLLAEGLPDLHPNWQGMLVVLAVLSLMIGNVVAIAQINIKRMLAYSTIGHIGFILMGLLAGTHTGYASALFYTLIYALMALGAFGMVILLSRKGFEAENLDDFRGLNERHPWFAFIMLLIMFSMAGVPPTVGFYAKLVVLQAIIEIDLVWLAILAVLFSVVGAFYYLRVVKLMYFDRPTDLNAIRPPWDTRLALSVNGLAMLALGLFPGGLLALCAGAVGFR